MERVIELRQMATRCAELSALEKSSSDAKYSLTSAYSYLIAAANAIAKLLPKPKK